MGLRHTTDEKGGPSSSLLLHISEIATNRSVSSMSGPSAFLEHRGATSLPYLCDLALVKRQTDRLSILGRPYALDFPPRLVLGHELLLERRHHVGLPVHQHDL
jgi:hypothetical protein